MDETRGEHGNALQNYGIGSFVHNALTKQLALLGKTARRQGKDGAVECVEKLRRRLLISHDKTQICLQGRNLMAKLKTPSNMSKEHFRLGVTKKAISVSYFRLDEFTRRVNNLVWV